MREASKKLSLVAGSLVAGLMIGELGIRYLGSYDADGNFTVLERSLRPYRFPVTQVRKIVSNLTSPTSISSNLIYDPFLGWVPRPNHQSSNGLYRYNSHGIRSAPKEYSMLPQQGVLRIAVFGDSFTHCNEVPFEQTWEYYLEAALKKNGLAAEVLNLGVPGYGMDQAFLRWREFGHKFSPDLVIFGLQMENVKRNLNLIRPVYYRGTDLPFSKPRFLLNGDRLDLINVPAVPPEELPELLTNIDTWRFAKHEYFINLEDYRYQSWYASKLLSLVDKAFYGMLRSPETDEPFFHELSGEPALLAQRILREFKQSVEGYNKRFLIVHLPARPHLKNLLIGENLPDTNLLASIDRNHSVIHPEFEMLEEAKKSSLDILFEKRGHYSSRGNEILASVIASYILSNHGEETLSPKR